MEKGNPSTNKKPTSLARKAGIFTVSKAVTIISQLLAMVTLTHVLSEENAGIVFFLLTIYATAQTFGQLGLPDSIFYFFEKYPAEKRKSVAILIGKTLFGLSILGAVLLMVIAYIGAAKEGFEQVATLGWIMAALLILELPTVPIPNLLISLDRTKGAAWFNLFVGLTQFFAIVIPLFLPNPVSGVAVGLLIYGGIRFTVSGFIFRRLFKNEKSETLPAGTLKEVLRYSVPLSLAQVFWGLNRQVDKYVVQWFLPISMFAVYSAGAYELPIIPGIAYSIASVMMPLMVGHHLKGERDALLALWEKSIKKVTVIVVPLVMVFILAAEEFIALLFPESYADAALPFRIYSVILLQRVASYSNMQKALGSTKEITKAAFYLFFINAALCIPLVLWLGMAGPPLASLFANAFSWWYALRVIQKLLKTSFRQVFPWGFYGKTLLVAGLATVPFFILKSQWALPGEAAFGVLAIGYLMVFGLAGVATGIIEKEDVRRILKRKK